MAITVRELIVKLSFKVDEAGLKNSEKRVKGVGKKMKTAFLGVGAAVVAIGALSIKAAGDMEMLTTQFEVMLGSAEAANDMMKELKTFAATTPFALKDLAQGTQTLLSFGVAQDKVIGTMRMLGDTAGGNKEKLNGLVLAYGKVQTKGKASMEEINMIAERGVPIIGTLQKQLGVTEQEFFKLVSAGKIGRKEITQAFQTMTSEGGMFFKGMEKQSLTFQGLVSTAKDNLVLMAAKIGESLLPVAKELIVTFTELVQGPLGDLLNSLIGSLLPVIKLIGPLLSMVFKSLQPLIKIIEVSVGIISKLLETVMMALAPVMDLLMMAFTQIANILEALQPALDVIIGIMQYVIQLFTDMMMGPLGELTNLLGEMLVMVSELLSELLEAFAPLIKMIIKIAVGFAAMRLKFIVGILRLIMKVLGPILRLFSAIVSVIMKQLQPVIEWIGKAFEGLQVIFEKVFNGIMKFFSNIMDGIIKGINLMITGLNKLRKNKIALLLTSEERAQKEAAAAGAGTVINQNNDIDINAPAGAGRTSLTPDGVGKVAGMAFKSAFNYELRQVIIASGR